VRSAIADTSVFIARESGRPLDIGALPDSLQVSVITIGELRAGVLAATDLARRNLRLATLTQVLAFDPLPVDHDVAEAWALLRVQLRDAGRRMPVNDSWIAATAMAHRLAVATQDDDYDAVDGLDVIRV
jgi:predicted nucleic acid-binding protein